MLEQFITATDPFSIKRSSKNFSVIASMCKETTMHKQMYLFCTCDMAAFLVLKCIAAKTLKKK
jgi:hypothetical protein